MTRLCYNTVIASNGCFMQQNRSFLEHSNLCVWTESGPLGDLTLTVDLQWIGDKTTFHSMIRVCVPVCGDRENPAPVSLKNGFNIVRSRFSILNSLICDLS
jgi:hypothetical protein